MNKEQGAIEQTKQKLKHSETVSRVFSNLKNDMNCLFHGGCRIKPEHMTDREVSIQNLLDVAYAEVMASIVED